MIRPARVAALFLISWAGLGPHRAHAAPAASSRDCGADHIRWATASNTLYVTGAVQCTLTDISRLVKPSVPLKLVDAPKRIWWLGANLVLEGGATLLLDGSAPGGDVGELRLRSDNTSAPHAFVELRAMWGTLTVRNTRLTSWDDDKGGPDTEYETYGRAFVRAVSYLDGTTPRESRMDVIDSEIGHLGYNAAESYGLVWKVRGDAAGIFDLVDVMGDVTGSSVHDNYFGMYTYGAFGMNIVGNEFFDNVMYGVDPHDDSDALVVEGNNIHDNGNHGFICSKRCDKLSIRDNTSSNNAGVGFMLHHGVTDSVVQGNVAENNGTGGFAIVDSHHNVFRKNTARGNQFGIRLSTGASDNVIADNLFNENIEHGIYTYVGSDPPSINDGRPARNRFTGNDVSENAGFGIRLNNGFMNEFIGNVFRDNVRGVASLSDSSENVFRTNDLSGGHLLAQGESTNYVVDSDQAEVLLGDEQASFVFTDSSGRVFQNPLGLETLVEASGSTLTLTGKGDSAPLAIEALPLAVSPTGGSLRVLVSGWEEQTRAWRATPVEASSVTFTLGGLEPGVRYDVWVDGARKSTVLADRAGSARFSSTLARVPRSFRVAPARAGGKAPAPNKFGI